MNYMEHTEESGKEETKNATESVNPVRPVRMWSSPWMIITGVGVIVIVACVATVAVHGRMMRRDRAYSGGYAQGMMQAGPGGGQPGIQGGMMGRRGAMGRGSVHGSAARGTLGALTKIDGNTLTVHVRGTDETVAVTSSTSYYKAGVIAKQSDLQVGDILVVSGNPDSNGVIQALSIDIR